MIKFSLIISMIFLASCSLPDNIPDSSATKPANTSINNKDPFIAKVSEKKGASILLNIKINQAPFKTKAASVTNKDGIVEKKPTDIAKVDVYLFSLSPSFSDTNPLGISNVNVVKSFTDVVRTGSSFQLLFTSVPGLASNHYWAGVVAKDSAGNVISKPPAIPWTDDTFSTAPALALSDSGVGVDETTLEVSTATALNVDISLLDAVGAEINTTVGVTAGNNNLSSSTVEAQ